MSENEDNTFCQDDHTVSEVIKALQSMYKPEDKILVMWWDKNLPYLEHTPSDSVWEKVLNKVAGGPLDYASGLIWDTIAEEIELTYKELGKNHE